MPTKAFLAALAAAALGALAWALVAYYMKVEIGYLAIGVGAAIGFASKVAGGKGESAAISCAALAAVAILCGKLVTVNFVRADAGTEISAMFDNRDMYDEMMTDANDLAALPPDDDLRAYLIAHDYSEAASPGDVTEGELADFRDNSEELLRRLAKEQPDFDGYKKLMTQQVLGTLEENLSLWELVKADLGFIDLLFFVFGVGAAYSVAKDEN